MRSTLGDTVILQVARRLGRASVLALAGLAAAANGAAAMSYRFTTAPDGCDARPCIIAAGPIDDASVRDLKAFVRANGVRPGAVVVLDSPGGGTLDGVALGVQIRKLGLATTVQKLGGARDERLAGACASACAYAFLGGVERSVGDGARLGVHQMASAPDGPSLSAADAQWVAGMIAVHVERMGANVGVLTAAMRTPPNRLHWFSPAELARLRLITDGPPKVILVDAEAPPRTGVARSVSLDVR